MNEKEVISFVRFKRENREYSSLGHYQGKKSVPRPVNLGQDLTRSSIFPKRKGDFTRNIRQSRSVENLHSEKSPKANNLYVLRKSASFSSGINGYHNVFEESYFTFHPLPKNIIKNHLLLSDSEYSRGKASSFHSSKSYVFVGCKKDKSLRINSLGAKRCHENSYMERKHSKYPINTGCEKDKSLLIYSPKTKLCHKNSYLDRNPSKYSINAGCDKNKNHLIYSLEIKMCLKNSYLERKPSSFFFQFHGDGQKKSIPRKSDLRMEKPFTAGILLSSTSTQCVDISTRRSASFDPRNFVNRNQNSSPEGTSLQLTKKSHIFNPYLTANAKKVFLTNNMNSVKTLRIAADGILEIHRAKEAKFMTESLKKLGLGEKLNIASHKISFMRQFKYKINLRTDTPTTGINRVLKQCSSIQNNFHKPKYSDKISGQVDSLQNEFQHTSMFSKEFMRSYPMNSMIFVQEDCTTFVNCDIRHMQDLCQLLPFGALPYTSTPNTEIIPSRGLNFNGDFDKLSLLQNGSDFVISTSALTRFPNSNVAFILFIKSFYGNFDDVYLFNMALEDDSAYQAGGSAKTLTFSRKSCVTLDITNASNCLSDIKICVIGYRTIKNLRHLYEDHSSASEEYRNNLYLSHKY